MLFYPNSNQHDDDLPGRSLKQQSLQLLPTERLGGAEEAVHALDHRGLEGEKAGDVAGPLQVENRS